MDEDLLYEISLLSILSGKIAEAQEHVVAFEEALANTTGLIYDLAVAVGKLREASAGEAEKPAANNGADELSRNGNNGIQEQECACETEMSLLTQAINNLNTNVSFLATEEQQQLVPAIDELTKELAASPRLTQYIVVNQYATENIMAPPQGNEKTYAGPGKKKSDEGLSGKINKDVNDVAGYFIIPTAIGTLTGTEAFVAAWALGTIGLVALVDIVQYYGKAMEQEDKKDARQLDSQTGEVFDIPRPETDNLKVRKPYIDNSLEPLGGQRTPDISVAETPETQSVTNIVPEKQWGNDNPLSEFEINTIPAMPPYSFREGHIPMNGGDKSINNSSGYPSTQGTQSITVTNIPDSTVVRNKGDEEEKRDKYNQYPELNTKPARRFPGNFIFTNSAGEKNITINIYGGLIRNFTVNSAGAKESASYIKKLVEGAILDALKDVEIQN